MGIHRWCTLVACIAIAAAQGSTADAGQSRTLTVTKPYTIANSYTVDSAEEMFAVHFPTPAWARSVTMAVTEDATFAIVYRAHWSGTDSATINCSIANGSFDDPPTKQAMRRVGRGDLLIAPVTAAYTRGSQDTFTYRTCPYTYVTMPTHGTISVTFSSRALPPHKHL